jgi:hypothetical protein
MNSTLETQNFYYWRLNESRKIPQLTALDQPLFQAVLLVYHFATLLGFDTMFTVVEVEKFLHKLYI